MSFSTSAFGYSLVVNTSQSKPIIGSASSPQLDLTFTATTASSTLSSIFLYLTDTDFVTSGSFLMTLGGTNSGDSGTLLGEHGVAPAIRRSNSLVQICSERSDPSQRLRTPAPSAAPSFSQLTRTP
jgi:hypothetical protein